MSPIHRFQLLTLTLVWIWVFFNKTFLSGLELFCSMLLISALAEPMQTLKQSLWLQSHLLPLEVNATHQRGGYFFPLLLNFAKADRCEARPRTNSRVCRHVDDVISKQFWLDQSWSAFIHHDLRGLLLVCTRCLQSYEA